MSQLPPPLEAEFARVQRGALVAGVAALAVCAVGAFFDPAQFLRAYLTAHQFFLGIALGCLAILMLYHLTGGAWGFLVRRFLEAAMRTLPLLAILFVPVALGVRTLYLWADPEVVAGNRELQYNHVYLNVPFWCFRAFLWFALWILVAWLLSAWSREQDRSGAVRPPRKFRLLSAPGLVLYGVAITFGSIDWVMSLQPTFRSTIFGPMYASGQLLTGQAAAILALAWLAGRPPFRALLSPDVLNDLGNLLFTFLVIWAYMHWFQFMLIWMANLPEEVIWYLPRQEGGWRWVIAAVAVFHFAVPFFLLLLRDVKRDVAALGRVSGLVLFMHLVFMYWLVEPPLGADRLTEHWMDFLTPVGVGGLWLWYFLWQLGRYPILALHDPDRESAAELRRQDEEAAARAAAIHDG